MRKKIGFFTLVCFLLWLFVTYSAFQCGYSFDDLTSQDNVDAGVIATSHFLYFISTFFAIALGITWVVTIVTLVMVFSEID